VKDDSTAELRPVTLGQRQGDLVAVTEGLKAGERVITAGQLLVAPGGKVRIEEAPAPDASKATGGSAGQAKPVDASAGQAKATGASGEQSKAPGASSAGKDAAR
jgi:hypothetical protein